MDEELIVEGGALIPLDIGVHCTRLKDDPEEVSWPEGDQIISGCQVRVDAILTIPLPLI